MDVTQPIRLSFKHWLDALFIAQKYKKELKADSAEQSSETTNEDGTPTSKSIPSELGLEFDFQRLLNTASERARYSIVLLRKNRYLPTYIKNTLIFYGISRQRKKP